VLRLLRLLPGLGDHPGPQEPPEAVEGLHVHRVDLLTDRPVTRDAPEPPSGPTPRLRDVRALVVPHAPSGVLGLVLEPPRKAPERGDDLSRAPGPPLRSRGEPVVPQERRRDLRGLREEHA